MRLRNIPHADEAVQNHDMVIQFPKEHHGRWDQVFGNDAPIHIEIGAGKGRFIRTLAAQNPDINYIAIERYSSVLVRALERREIADVLELSKQSEEKIQSSSDEYIPNLRYICMDARELPEVFDQAEVAKIYLNFSDPWPKARHAKRRLTSREFLRRYEKVLLPGGVVELKTDNVDLFDFSIEEFEECHWKVEGATYDLHHDEEKSKGNIMTEYEAKFSAMGKPICKCIASPRATPEEQGFILQRNF